MIQTEELMSLLHNGYSASEVLLLCEIIRLSNDNKGCTASNEYLMNSLKISKNSFHKYLNHFKQSHVITTQEIRGLIKGTIRHIYVNNTVLIELCNEGQRHRALLSYNMLLEEFKHTISLYSQPQNIKSDLAVGYVYFIKQQNQYKIGYSKNPYNRIYSFDTYNNPVEIIAISNKHVNAYPLEQWFHRTFKEYQIPDKNEWYILSQDIVSKITSLILTIE